MRASPLQALLICLLLAGCTFFGENSEGADRSEYDGGIGYALVVSNNATDPFEVTLRVLGVNNADVGHITKRLGPGERLEKWWGLDAASTYSVRLNYTWQGAEGGAASQGLDDQTFSTSDCPTTTPVTRLAWDLRQAGTSVGHAYLGKACVAAADA